jgi:hypothetical protein
MPPIDVCITIDTEVDINGSLEYPDLCEPIGSDCVWRHGGGRSQGLGFILDTLETYGFRGTFFLEVMNTHYFGEGPMAEIAEVVRARGHDLQLHLHPCWCYLPGRKAGTVGADGYTDAITDFQGAELLALLREGRDIFERVTGAAPLAFRSGSLVAHRALFPALAAAGFRLSSTIGVGIYEPADAMRRCLSGRAQFDGVTELPVLTYSTPRHGYRRADKLATIIGSAFQELRTVLDRAAAVAAGPIVILTHASEYSGRVDPTGNGRLPRRSAPTAARPCRPAGVGDPAGPTQYRPWPRMQRRLDRLCRHLHAHPERFRVTTFSERHDVWTTAPVGDTPAPLLRSGLLGLGVRSVENLLLPRLGLR